MWIGTSTGGLNRWRGDGDGFYHFTETDGLSDNTVEGLLESNDGRIFAGTQRGITSYDPDTGQVTIIDRNAGLYGIEFNSGHHKDHDDALLFGGPHGVTRIPPDFLLRERMPPRVHIVDVQVYHQSLDLHRPSYNDTELALGANERAVSFSYIALDYAAPASLEYRYILEGIDDGWVYAGERTFVSYTNLPPGTYTFRVAVAGPFPIAGAAEASLTVSVPTPAWRRWWAFCIYGAAFVLIAYGGLRIYDAAALKQKNEALAEANRMLEVANEELSRLAVNDPLTSVYNRRYFEDRMNEQISRSRRHRESVAVVMVDVDHFKQYNDERGHVAGDECLQQIAAVLRSAVGRAGDFVARYGGEEFALLLVDSELDGAAAVAEGVRKRVERDTDITISAGVYATVPDASTTRELLVRNADRALYRAKQDGRNRVALFRDRATGPSIPGLPT
jgi:diguanylate cyclase (GGDEF)-like protein